MAENEEPQPYVFQEWPKWATGPNGERAVFGSEAEVPAGWTHGDGQKGKAKAAAGHAGEAPSVDAAGVAWDPARHASTKALTKDGLWRMKVGVARPPEESKPQPPLDL